MLSELPWEELGNDVRAAIQLLPNGDYFQVFDYGDVYSIYQVDEVGHRNRRHWWNTDALAAQCILNALLEDPLMQFSDHPER